MLKHLLNQTCVIYDPTDTSTDAYGNAVHTYTQVAQLACRVQTTKGMEVEVDRDTRKTWFKLHLDERAAGLINARSRVVLLENDSQLGTTIEDNRQYIEGNPVFEVFGEPQVHRTRLRISHVEATLRTIEA
jgi:hypothetical protein